MEALALRRFVLEPRNTPPTSTNCSGTALTTCSVVALIRRGGILSAVLRDARGEARRRRINVL